MMKSLRIGIQTCRSSPTKKSTGLIPLIRICHSCQTRMTKISPMMNGICPTSPTTGIPIQSSSSHDRALHNCSITHVDLPSWQRVDNDFRSCQIYRLKKNYRRNDHLNSKLMIPKTSYPKRSYCHHDYRIYQICQKLCRVIHSSPLYPKNYSNLMMMMKTIFHH